MEQMQRYLGPHKTRALFCEWYHSPAGEILRDLESRYLSEAVSIRFNQLVLQVGSLGWEELFLDLECFRNFSVVDTVNCADEKVLKIIADMHQLPVDSESIDLVIMPHSLEFELEQHLILREVERVLKPEGKLIFLGFNPWSIYRLYQFVPGRRGRPPWCGNFLSRQRVLDWLALLNFKTQVSTGFYLRSSSLVSDPFEGRLSKFSSVAYAIKAVKRRYTVIPLKPRLMFRPGFVASEEGSAGFGACG